MTKSNDNKSNHIAQTMYNECNDWGLVLEKLDAPRICESIGASEDEISDAEYYALKQLKAEMAEESK